MQIEEVFNIKVKELQLQDDELRQKIVAIVKHDTMHKNGVIQEIIEDFAEAFLRQNYSQQELKAEIQYNIDLYRNRYEVTIVVKVYPIQHPRAYRYEAIMKDMLFDYVYFSYTKERNEMGAILEQKLEPYVRLVELQEENEELKRELQEKREAIEELREKVKRLSRELKRCK
jgi:hypothetical protein